MKATSRAATGAFTPTDPADAAKAFGSTVGEIWKSMSGLNLPLPVVSKLQASYLQQATDLWNLNLREANPDAAAAPKAAAAKKAPAKKAAAPKAAAPKAAAKKAPAKKA